MDRGTHARRPLLSWRVHILPNVEEGKLYDQFHLDEPWDSPHNKPLAAQTSLAYRSRLDTRPGYTTLQRVVGAWARVDGRSVQTFDDVTDSLDDTVMLVHVTPELAVPRSQPADFVFIPQAGKAVPLGEVLPGQVILGICMLVRP